MTIDHSYQHSDSNEPDDSILMGRYRLGDRLGAGGMGVVYRAMPLAGGQPVAIKQLLPRFQHHSTHRQRFIREARVASSIVHPNVVRVLDFGETEGGTVFLVMEYLAGDDLAQRLRREKTLSWSRARPILQQVLQGLRAAHQRGVLHRDIKPSNVFLVRAGPGEADRVKLLDFGLAKAIDPTSSFAAELTMIDEVVGTAHYMAPERVLGDPADIRSDLYSVGVMTFRMLFGMMPPGAEGTTALTEQRRNRSEYSSIDANLGTLPTAIEALVRRATAPVPSDRFSSLQEFEKQMMEIPIEGEARTAMAPPAPDDVQSDLPTLQLLRPQPHEEPSTVSFRRSSMTDDEAVLRPKCFGSGG